MNDAVALSARINPSVASFPADPYTVIEGLHIPKAIVENLCTPEQRHELIARAAYFHALRRGFEPGHELDDWLAAEHDVNATCGLLEPHPTWDSDRRG